MGIEMKTKILLVGLLFVITGCDDRYQEGYQNGYSDGASFTENRLNKDCEDKLSKQERESRASSYSMTSTEVCGGGGINLNGKHYTGGKTGCVRAYSDGRVERY